MLGGRQRIESGGGAEKADWLEEEDGVGAEGRKPCDCRWPENYMAADLNEWLDRASVYVAL